MFYRQCKLVRDEDNSVHVAWIPEQFAKVGKMLALRVRPLTIQTGCLVEELPGTEWLDGWRVDEVWTRASEEYVRDHERDFKTQREASDV